MRSVCFALWHLLFVAMYAQFVYHHRDLQIAPFVGQKSNISIATGQFNIHRPQDAT